MQRDNNIPKGYKLSSLGPIPNDWEVNKLGDLGQWKGGGTPSKSEPKYWNNGNIPWVSPKDMKTLLISETEDYITEDAIKNSATNLIQPLSILIVNRSGILRNFVPIALNKVPVTINQDLKALTVNRKSNYLFVFYSLLGFNQKLLFEAGKEGTTVESLDFDSIKNFKIPLPPLKEQTAIANLLSTWDKAINTLTQLIAQKELRKKWLMQQLLTGKKRLKGFSGEWREVRLSELFERVTRKNTEANTNVVTISAQKGFIKQEDFFNKIVASEITDNYFLVQRGEFCYNKSYSNGYPWGATKRLNDFDKAVVTTLYICFGIKDEDETYGDFFEQYFEAGLLDRGLMKIAHEGGRAHGLLNVTPSDFFDLIISIPDFEEQTAIATLLQTADAELNLFRQKLDKLKEQKKGLMQVLLTGKKRLNY